MSAKSNTELWDVLYAWIHSVLPSVEVVEGYEDAPSPKGNYIEVNYAGTWTLAGTAPAKVVHGRDDLPAPRVYVYRGQVQVRDVDGDGENLMLLVESLSDFEVLQNFEDSGCSVLRTSGPQLMPGLQQTKWRKESLLTLEMSWARGYEGTTLIIESVEITQVEKSVVVDSNENLIVDDQRNALQSEEILNKLNVVTEEA